MSEPVSQAGNQEVRHAGSTERDGTELIAYAVADMDVDIFCKTCIYIIFTAAVLIRCREECSGLRNCMRCMQLAVCATSSSLHGHDPREYIGS